ncbi:MAG: glycine betaine ABC transporter substrate-binding protein [Thioalkalivibrio sp.]
MFFLIRSRFSSVSVVIGLLLLSALLCGCSEEGAEGKRVQPETEEPVRLAYVPWDSEIASTHLVKAVITERLGEPVELLSVPLTALWGSVASGDVDASVAAWLPTLQRDQRQEHGDSLEILGPHLEGTRIGLAVPEYVEIETIGELAEHRGKFGGKIIGIDPQAGIMQQTEGVLETYELDGFQLVSGSDSTMTEVLGRAIEERRWVVVTAWTPHWKFAKWDLKYLEDPRGGFGRTERIHTLVREDLAEDRPRVHAFLERFSWEVEDMEELMLLVQQPDRSPEEAARAWIERNKDHVDQWLGE